MNRRLALSWLLLVPLAACGNKNPGFWQPQNQLLPTVALDDRVAFVETNSHTVFLLDPSDTALVPQQIQIGETPSAAFERNGANQLLVLSQGKPGSASQTEVAAQFQVIEATATSGAKPNSTPLDSRFDGWIQSDDGRFVVLYHTSAASDANTGAIYNPNELEIVDLASTPSTSPKVTLKSIRSLGGVPSGIVFSPSFGFTAGARALAVVLSQNYVTIVDLDHPDRTEISVPMCSQTSGCSYIPAQVVFDPTNLNIFVRASDATDVFQITLTDLGSAAPAAPENDFRASLSMLTVGSSAADMAVYGAGPTARLAVATPSAKNLLVIDPKTTSTTTVTTTIPVNTIMPFVQPSPGSAAPRAQALLVDTSSGSMTATFAYLDTIETAGSLALADYTMGAAATQVQPVNPQTVVLVYGKMVGSNAFSVLDLTKRSFSTIGSMTQLSNPTFDIVGARLWSVDTATNKGLHYFNLQTTNLAIGDVYLDQTIASILPLAKASSVGGPRFLVVGQSDPQNIGNITVLDADNPNRATARTAYGFLFSNYLERGQP
jgi:hypothetical protein